MSSTGLFHALPKQKMHQISTVKNQETEVKIQFLNVISVGIGEVLRDCATSGNISN